MNILFFTQDMGPARNLARIAVEAVDRGHRVKSFLLFRSNIAKHIIDSCLDCDVAMFTPSTLNLETDKEFIKKLKQNRKTIALFSDTYGTFLNPQVLQIAHLCDFVFVPDEFEKEKALRAGFNTVVVSGIPLWEDFCKPARYTGDDIRLSLGIPRGINTVLFVGIKKGGITKHAFEDLLFAISKVNASLFLIPRFRPEDEFFNEGNYEYLLRSRGIGFADSHRLYKNIGDLLPAADLVVSLASTVGIEAVYRRKRVIDYLPDYFCERLKELGDDGAWNPAELGATRKADSKESLALAINHLFTDDGFAELRKNQEKFYPLLEQGNAAKRVLDFLESNH
jgi:hypothetical protein